jgi:hypothetical protein
VPLLAAVLDAVDAALTESAGFEQPAATASSAKNNGPVSLDVTLRAFILAPFKNF